MDREEEDRHKPLCGEFLHGKNVAPVIMCTNNDAKNNIDPGSAVALFFERTPPIPLADEVQVERQVEWVKAVADLVTENLYVVDFSRRCFRYVAAHDLLTDGYSPDEVLRAGYGFYPKIIHPDDLPLFIRMHRIMLDYLYAPGADRQYPNHFSFTLRICHQGKYLMTYHKWKPMTVDGKISVAVCTVASSVVETPGNLEANHHCPRYACKWSFEKQQWMPMKLIQLNIREKEILSLAKQGKSEKETADILCISHGTLRNFEASLYRKLNVHSMIQAVIFATNRRIIFVPDGYEEDIPEQTETVSQRRTRRLITPDMRQRIQDGLNSGESIRSMARQEKIAESAIRYAIKQKKMTSGNISGALNNQK
jgi:DNA-binding CsgD family transcriptional regulator